MKLHVSEKRGVPIAPGMIGLFFEDINYAADGGLYAEMIENRSFEFVEARGTNTDYYTVYDGGYGWKAYPEDSNALLEYVSGSPLYETSPHYLRFTAKQAGEGFSNKAYIGIFLKKGMDYKISFYARMAGYKGNLKVSVVKDGKNYGTAEIACIHVPQGEWQKWNRYEAVLHASEDVKHALFVITLEEPGCVEFDHISMMPGDAVAGIFRKDLFEKLKELKPGFLRFPGGCIIEGNTLSNRYRFKNSLGAPEERISNWNRWAVHQNGPENDCRSIYSHYNQTLGLGYYEYFLLCELIGAKPLPVLSVGLACQYMSCELVSMDDPAFQEFIQDALDLIEFANGTVETKWGSLRAKMGHPAPFGLELLGIGNEQWQTEKADFFQRYMAFEKAIHAKYPEIRLIGSAGPDITSERYTAAWEFYRRECPKHENFAYALDEHYYVKPEWFYEHTDFYDNYSRDIKVFSGEYAAHPVNGMNRPDANTLGGALAEAALLTGVERNADVVVLASYAPLFARIGYTQWSPDLIWFDETVAYGSPSYYVQKMYGENMGTVTLDTEGQEKELRKDGVYYSSSLDENSKEIILKIVNSTEEKKSLSIDFASDWNLAGVVKATTLHGESKEDFNSVNNPEKISSSFEEASFNGEITLEPNTFLVARFPLA